VCGAKEQGTFETRAEAKDQRGLVVWEGSEGGTVEPTTVMKVASIAWVGEARKECAVVLGEAELGVAEVVEGTACAVVHGEELNEVVKAVVGGVASWSELVHDAIPPSMTCESQEVLREQATSQGQVK